MSAIIKQLTDKENANDLLPITNIKAVYDDAGNRLDNTLDNVNQNLSIAVNKVNNLEQNKYKHITGTATIISNTSCLLGQIDLPNDGGIYIIIGQARNQSGVGKVVSLQLQNCLLTPDMYITAIPQNDYNWQVISVALGGRSVYFRGWGTVDGSLPWELMYAKIN